MNALPSRIDVLLDLRARVLAAETALDDTAPASSAAERFDRRTRVGALRHEFASEVSALRRDLAGDDPVARRRIACILMLIDEIVHLRHEATTAPDPAMRAAMESQALAELHAELAGVMDMRATRADKPALRLVHTATA